jgi:hypothetical protein
VDWGVYYLGSWHIRLGCGFGCVLFGELARQAWVWIWVCIICRVGQNRIDTPYMRI